MRCNRLRIGRLLVSLFAALFVSAACAPEALAISEPPRLKSLDASSRAGAPKTREAHAHNGKVVAHAAKVAPHGKGEADPKGRAKEAMPAKSAAKPGATPRAGHAPKGKAPKADAPKATSGQARGAGVHARPEKDKVAAGENKLAQRTR